MKKPVSGFTLIELMVVVVIIAIIAAVAIPSYQQHIIRTRRAAAEVCMMEQAQWMERFYTTNMTYAGAALPPTPCQIDLAAFYQMQFNAVPTATTYSIDAIPIGPQAADTCGTLNIDQAGTKTPNPVANPICWR